MADNAQWEYRVLTIGGSWTGFKVEATETTLNELGQDGWEVVNTLPEPAGGARLVVVAKRPLTEAVRRRRNYSE
jgi:hypothetical protein